MHPITPNQPITAPWSPTDMAIPQTCPFLEVPGQGSHTRIMAEYIWIGGSGNDLRCKTMTLEKVPTKVEDLRVWNFDGR